MTERRMKPARTPIIAPKAKKVSEMILFIRQRMVPTIKAVQAPAMMMGNVQATKSLSLFERMKFQR